MAYHRLEPFGQDYLHLMIAQLLLATGRATRGTTVADLVPGEGVPERADPDALRRKGDSVFGALRAMGVPGRQAPRRR